ncbi:MAG: hypothetical protein ACR2NM_00085 [Bythopirellula sp.]
MTANTTRLLCLAIAMTLVIGFATSAHAISFGQVDDFQDGSTQGWGDGGLSANPPINQLNAGPSGAGDHALEIRTNGAPGGAGSRLVALNPNQWAGDFLAAGVSSISVDLSSPNNVPLNVRLALRGAGGDFVTPDMVVPAGTGLWNNYTYSLAPGDLIAAGGFDVVQTLGGVSELRILHNPDPSIRGATVGGAIPFVGRLLVDNITALPEPATWVMLTLSAVMLPRRRGR